MPPDEVAAVVETPNADDVFAAAFAQLSEADAKANGPMPKPEPNPNAQGQRTEDDRATGEAQRDAKAFAKPDVVGPTGPDVAASARAGTTGATGSGAGVLPADDKEKATAAEALAAAEAAKVAQGVTGPTGGGPQMDDNELVKRLAGLIKGADPVDDRVNIRQEPADPLAMFNEAEKKFLADYEKEYPDIARAEFMRRRVENQQLVNWVFSQINAAIAPKFAEIDGLLTRTHAGDLQQVVPTYNNELRERVVTWAGTQPAYKKVAYEYVIKQGTVDEVADMIADFQKATGYVAPAKPDAAADPAKAVADAAKAAAAAKLAPVKSGNAQRGVTAIAPTDYDGAFDWATKLLEKA